MLLIVYEWLSHAFLIFVAILVIRVAILVIPLAILVIRVAVLVVRVLSDNIAIQKSLFLIYTSIFLPASNNMNHFITHHIVQLNCFVLAIAKEPRQATRFQSP